MSLAATLMSRSLGLSAQAFPAPEPLEETAAAEPQDLACALAFALSRALAAAAARGDARPLAVAATGVFFNERGGLFARGVQRLGLGPERLILVRAARESEALWAMEEALKSGAISAVLGAVEAPSFVATRRLDFAARAGQASAVLLRARVPHDLSAARLRWRIAAAPSGLNLLDARAPGPARLKAELVRSRSGAPGAWTLEQDDETHRFGLVAGLADHGLAAGQDTGRRAA